MMVRNRNRNTRSQNPACGSRLGRVHQRPLKRWCGIVSKMAKPCLRHGLRLVAIVRMRHSLYLPLSGRNTVALIVHALPLLVELVRSSASLVSAEHTHFSLRIKSEPTCNQKRELMRVCSMGLIPARPFLYGWNIVMLSTSTTKMVSLKRSRYYATIKRKTSCSANVSFTLMCTSIYSSGKFAAALKTIKNLKGPRSIPPHSRDEASVVPVSLREWCLASYHDTPFIRCCTSSHVQNSSHRPWAFWATIMATSTLPLMRRNFAIFLYIWYVYRLMGGTATGMLVHFPVKGARFTKEIHQLVIATVRIASSLGTLSSGNSKRSASVSQIVPKNTSSVVGSSMHLGIDIK